MNFKDAYNPTKGVKTDFSCLLERFSERESVRYEQFAEVWRSMKFSYLCAGRKSERECREFFEEVNHIALSYYLPPFNFQVRVGGLYILYGLYITQPCIPKVPIRVTHGQWKQILQFQENVHNQKHLDVEFVFQKLFCHHVFMFVATPREVYIKAKEKSGENDNMVHSKLQEVADSVPTMFTPEIMQQLQAIHNQYQQLKLGIAGPNAVRPDRSLAVVEDEIITTIDECIGQHILKMDKIRYAQTNRPRRKQEESDSEEQEDTEAEHLELLPSSKSIQARVKAQAYTRKAKQSKGRRHRTILTQDASASSPEKVSKVQAKKRKRKKGQKTEDSHADEQNFLSSSIEESSEVMMSGDEYLSMPMLETDNLPRPGTVISSKTVTESKNKTFSKSKSKTSKTTKSSKNAKMQTVLSENLTNPTGVVKLDKKVKKGTKTKNKKKAKVIPTKAKPKSKARTPKAKASQLLVKARSPKAKASPLVVKARSPMVKARPKAEASQPKAKASPLNTETNPPMFEVNSPISKASTTKSELSPPLDETSRLKVSASPPKTKASPTKTKASPPKTKAKESPKKSKVTYVTVKRKQPVEIVVHPDEPMTKVQKTSEIISEPNRANPSSANSKSILPPTKLTETDSSPSKFGSHTSSKKTSP